MGGSRNSAGGRTVPYQDTVSRFLAGEIDSVALPPLLGALWRDGFFVGQQRAQVRVDRANREADYWYYVANNPAELRAEHERTLKHFDVVQARKKAGAA